MIKTFHIGNNSLAIDYKRKTISSLMIDDEEFIFGDVPFFTIKTRDRNGSHKYISAYEFAFIDFDNGLAKYHHDDFDVNLSIKAGFENICWGIEIKNHTDLMIEQVELMSMGLCPKLKDEGGKGEICFPFNEGSRVTSVSYREASGFRYYDVDYPSLGVYSMFPNMIFAPFMLYISNGRGVYLGMHDKTNTPKHIDFKVNGNVLKTIMSVFSNANYGQDYHMDFESVIEFFEGDYFVGCDIYKKYFDKCIAPNMRTISDRYNELPKWYHESPIVLTYPVCGKSDSDTEMKPGGLYPYTNGLDIVDRYSKATDSKMMVLLMQWEGTAPWAPPYVWPPYGDKDNFDEYLRKLHSSGHYLGLYTSGFGWTQKSYRRQYDKSDVYEKENLSTIMCANTNGDIRSTVVEEIRYGYDICPALEKSKELIADEAAKMINAGVDYIQILDQNHGGNPYFCYSDKHGHVPAPGKWQIKETNALLGRIDKSHCLLGCESAASEPYINQLMFSDNRYILNYHIGEPIPMYAYIYHEYVNNFMGNQICTPLSNERYSLTYRLAYSFINGDMLTLVIDGDGKLRTAWGNETVVDEKMPLELIKNINKWRLGKFEEFLHFGKMVKPINYACSKKEFGFRWGDHRFRFNSVLSGAYTNGTDTYQFFVNYDNTQEEIELAHEKICLIEEPDGDEKIVNGRKLEIPPLKMIAIKIK